MTALSELRIRDLGGFFVGGELAALSGQPVQKVRYAQNAPPMRVDPNGTYAAGHVYVQYVRLAETRKAPILFLNGGTFTGAMWETTPDGRPGWQRLFLERGHSTYLTDAVGKGRAGYAPFPDIMPEQPLFRPLEETWQLLRLGPRYTAAPDTREAFPGVQFPIDAFDTFARQGVPRFTGQEAVELAAYDQLLDRIGRCIVVAQSSGGYLATQLAARRPGRIAAIVTAELTAAPDAEAADSDALVGVPQLVLWGDYLTTSEMWRRTRDTIGRYAERVNRRGGRVDMIDLPSRGIAGNTHQMMMDRNNGVLAAIVSDWLDGALDGRAGE